MSAYDDFLRSYYQQHDLMKHAEDMRRSLLPFGTQLEGLLEMQKAFERTRSLYAGPADYVRDIQEKLLMQPTLPISGYQAELDQWTRLQAGIGLTGTSNDFLQHFATTPSLQLHKVLEEINAQLRRPGMAALPDSLQSALYAPPLDYSAFARRSVESVTDPTSDRSRAIQASVVLAESQLEDGTRIVTAALDTADETRSESSEIAEVTSAVADSGAPPATPAAITLFENQQAELLVVAQDLDPTFDYETLVDSSLTARQVQAAHGLCERVVQLNQARKLQGAAEIFPPTTAMLGAINMLSYSGVGSQRALGFAVDALYILLYEGSGEAKRILQLIRPERCEALWVLKQLRNVWLRHDPEHGSENEQNKKWAKLREGLAFLELNSLPVTEAGYQELYLNLLGALSMMMEELMEAVLAS